MLNHHDRLISNWLLIVCAAILIMLIIGGATRLTHSSLSIVEWDSSLGWIPPANEVQWQESFQKYESSSGFHEHESEPTLKEFKHLFMLEYMHWVWGCLIAIIFVFPCFLFLKNGWIKPSVQLKLALILSLGALQGLLGWYLVKIGLLNQPYASQYRLSIHLLAAFMIFGYILWVAMSLRYPDKCSRNRPFIMLNFMTLVLMAWVLLTVVSGGLVAGLQAGLEYDQMVFQDGHLMPDNYWALQPWYVNIFKNTVAVLSDHVIMAASTLIFVVLLWMSAMKARLSWRARSAYGFLLFMALAQVVLGIANVWLEVPILLGVAHHVCAVLLFSAAVLCNHALRFTDRLH